MNQSDQKLWSGVSDRVRELLRSRDYAAGALAERVAGPGVDAGELLGNEKRAKELRACWIPGVEVFARAIHPQRHRGVFGEFARRDEGILKAIGLWPAQWATARMFAGSAKGFHIHPPRVPDGRDPSEWFRSLFAEGADKQSERPYEQEQWDVMFFVQGRVEVFLREARVGLEPRVMHFFIDGDNHRGPNNVGLVVPAGVAHAFRVEGNEDAIMVYGTSTAFRPDFEGRIASEIETADLPAGWQEFLSGQ